MAKFREAPCEFYICHGECKKNRDADYNKLCQTCNGYRPRPGYKSIGNAKRHKEKTKYIE